MSTSAPADPKKNAHEYAVFLAAIQKAADPYPKPQGVKFSYGTAGFRTL
jgi:phosphoacetylglucosamine mutase